MGIWVPAAEIRDLLCGKVAKTHPVSGQAGSQAGGAARRCSCSCSGCRGGELRASFQKTRDKLPALEEALLTPSQRLVPHRPARCRAPEAAARELHACSTPRVDEFSCFTPSHSSSSCSSPCSLQVSQIPNFPPKWRLTELQT